MKDKRPRIKERNIIKNKIMDGFQNLDFTKIPIPSIEIPDVVKNLDPMKNYIPHSVLILGNGFDLDLGIRTKYKDFAGDNNYWPFKESSSFEKDSLPFFLNKHKSQVDTWFDLEELLACYASENKVLSKEKISQAKQDFSILSRALKEYLIKQEEDFVELMHNSMGNAKRMTAAHKVLQLFLKKRVRSIYTFNYTNTFRIANQLILKFEGVFNHVHGSTIDDNIILGAGDQRQIKDVFFEFYKSASPFYKSNNLVEDLNNADEVYIFGHSLGKNDHDYFSEFFKMASKNVHRPFVPGKIKVRIFTLDDKSEIEIKKQLMTLTENHLIGLYAHCDFKILKTDNKYQEWMSHDEFV